MPRVPTLACFLAACGGGRVPFVGGSEPDAGADAATCIPSDLAVLDPDRFDAIVDRSVADEPVTDGDWANDFGDAPGYAPPMLHAAAGARCEDALGARAEETVQYGLRLVDDFASEMNPEAILAGFGFIETMRVTGRPDLAEPAREAVDLTFGVLDLVGGYIPTPLLVDSAGDPLPYGQTASSALAVILGLRYVEVVDPTEYVLLARALEGITEIEDRAWSVGGGYYLHNADEDGDAPYLELYPNVAMMAAHALAYRLGGGSRHLDRAEALHDAIQPLYLPEVGGFHSTYSSDATDYVTLSSTNYLLMALRFLHEETGDDRYRETADGQLAFVRDVLWDPATRIAYHDWEDDARADWYCAGCQLQHAFVLHLYGE